ncbi:MAG: ADP-forming succinate--CoA ligase subunit beta [Calditrichaeota bacterium]|nr:MAG: ADP-forming succinate--CoA ligase subunit beta [Calditrichota bacterium]
MNIHEYQAKDILRRYGVAVPRGKVAFTPEEARRAAEELGGEVFVVKAQIHAGGRGKAGGVKLARSVDEVESLARQMLGMKLVTHQTGPEGKVVHRLLIEEGIDIARELYLGIVLDRSMSKLVFMASTEGGVEIEKVAAEHPEAIFKEYVEPAIGLQPYQARRLAFRLGLSGAQVKNAVKFMLSLYQAFVDTDASLAEINPLVVTGSGEVLALDAKMNFDDNALYRHPDIQDMRDLEEEDPLEVEASKYHLNYIKLDGNVGCMVNGAGLAMATMDIIKLAGGMPANFLDVGGGASVETVRNGFRILLSDPNVKAVLVNIFGGIVRCDRVAQGIIEAAKSIDITVPMVIRLAGTNAEEAARLLQESGMNFEVATNLEEAAQKVVKLAQAQ